MTFVRSPRLPAPVNGYSLTITSPVGGASVASRRPVVKFVPVSVLNDPVDVQVEWRTQAPYSYNGVTWYPSPTYATESLSLPSGQEAQVTPPADLSYTTWYYRLRAGSEATGQWGSWSSASRFINITPVLGSVAEYVALNVGAVRPQQIGTSAYVDINIGRTVLSPIPSAVQVTDLNLGLALTTLKSRARYTDMNVYPPLTAMPGARYADMNVDSTLPPAPRIWWIRPEQGREGYVFHIFGHGFGGYQNEYNGTVRLGALLCQVVRWERIPPALRVVTVFVDGTGQPYTSAYAVPTVTITNQTVTFAAGDTIEFDVYWDSPSATRLDIHPMISLPGQTNIFGLPGYPTLTDTAGRDWVSDLPEAYGAWLHRKFVIPAGHTMVGKVGSGFGVGFYAKDGVTRRRARIRSWVVRAADGTVKAWLTGDDSTTFPTFSYTSYYGSVLYSSTYTQEGHSIVHGQGLDPDVITPEHGWLTVVIPSGAVSSMVKVVLG